MNPLVKDTTIQGAKVSMHQVIMDPGVITLVGARNDTLKSFPPTYHILLLF
jgi:hypothetical protein